jgi:uncharacterized protein YlxW (UPF0749 family)
VKELKQAQEKRVEEEKLNDLQKEYKAITNAINDISKDRGWVVFG